MRHFIISFAILLSSLGSLQAQTISVSGKVVDSSGFPLVGAVVLEEGTYNGVTIMEDGLYTLNVSATAELKATCMGYKDLVIAVNGLSTINFTLEEDAIGLEEVVITGYGKVVSKDKLTASISKVSSNVLESGVRSQPLNALYGSVSGVRISTTSGQPGTAPSILIRGGTSLSNTGTPLYIIDGMQKDDLADINSNDIESIEILKDAAATALYGARASNGVVMVTTKSGSSGKAEIQFKSTVGVNYLRQTHDFLNAADYLYWLRMGAYNAGQESLLSQANGFGTGNVYDTDGNTDPRGVWSTMFLTPENQFLLDYGYKTTIDPITGRELIYNEFSAREGSISDTALTQDYNISVSGGNNKGKYYSSLSWYDEGGFPINTYYKRISYKANATYNISDWLSSNINVNFSKSNKRSVGDLRNEPEFFGIMFSAPPTMRKYNLDGDLIVGHNYQNGNWSASIDNFYRRNDIYRLTLGDSFKAYITPSLYFKLSAMWYLYFKESESFNKEYIVSPTSTNSLRNAGASYTRQLTQTYNAILGYSKQLGDHNIDAVAGFEFYDKNNYAFSGSLQGATSDDFIALQYGSIDPATTKLSTTHTQERIMSAFMNASYDYRGKYLFSFSGRYDGYSKLINNRWGFFPGVSAAWNIYKEEFMAPYADVVSSLKLRAGYGQNGNVNIVAGPYDLQGDYGRTALYNGDYGILIDDLPYPNLRWEKTTSLDVAIEAGFFNRLSLSIGAYNKITSDLLATVSFPSSSGVGNQYTNNGRVRNRGLELEANYTIFKNRDWNINLAANFTYMRSKILSLPDNGNERNRQGGQEVYDPKTGETIWVRGYQEGQEYGESYAYQMIHIVRDEADLANYAWYVDTFPTKPIYGPEAWNALTQEQQSNAQQLRPGDAIWLDVNGDNKIDTFDQVSMGTLIPRWVGGAALNMSWKNFSLLARFDYSGGNVEFNKRIRYYLGAQQGTFNTIQEVKDTWTPDNPDAKYPIFLYGQGGRSNYRQANFLYDKQDYLCGREFTLSYKLPSKWLKQVSMKGLSLSLTAQNLFYLTASRFYTPEFGADTESGYPTPLTVVGTIKITL